MDAHPLLHLPATPHPSARPLPSGWVRAASLAVSVVAHGALLTLGPCTPPELVAPAGTIALHRLYAPQTAPGRAAGLSPVDAAPSAPGPASGPAAATSQALAGPIPPADPSSGASSPQSLPFPRAQTTPRPLPPPAVPPRTKAPLAPEPVAQPTTPDAAHEPPLAPPEPPPPAGRTWSEYVHADPGAPDQTPRADAPISSADRRATELAAPEVSAPVAGGGSASSEAGQATARTPSQAAPSSAAPPPVAPTPQDLPVPVDALPPADRPDPVPQADPTQAFPANAVAAAGQTSPPIRTSAPSSNVPPAPQGAALAPQGEVSPGSATPAWWTPATTWLPPSAPPAPTPGAATVAPQPVPARTAATPPPQGTPSPEPPGLLQDDATDPRDTPRADPAVIRPPDPTPAMLATRASQAGSSQTVLTDEDRHRDHVAVDAQATPLGRYLAEVERIVITRWYATDLPMATRTLGLTGDVTLQFHVDRRGHVAGLRVLTSSGHQALDVLALGAVPGAFPRFPRDVSVDGYLHRLTLRYRSGAEGSSPAQP